MRFGLYVHFPFCIRKCSYCDFYTVLFDEESVNRYQTCLKTELDMWARVVNGTVTSVYVGGGSPSIWPVGGLFDFIEHVSRRFDLHPDEFTLECNPQELVDERLESWRALGIDRLSVGVQNTSKGILGRVGRRTPIDLHARLRKAKNFFDNLNLDFILGLPGESTETVKANLALIEAVLPEHLSYYVLDRDNESDLMRQYHNGRIGLPRMEQISHMHELILESLENMGYIRYEVSSWKMKGFECLHNLAYWRSKDYLGVGAAAGGHFRNIRYVNTSNIISYADMLGRGVFPREYYSENSPVQELIEALFMGLRMTAGIDLADHMPDDSDLVTQMASLLKSIFGDHISLRGSKVSLTSEGLDLTNQLLQRLSEHKEEISSVFSARDTGYSNKH